MENQRRHKPFAVSIGREEHRRLKILAAELGSSMSDVINTQINVLWNNHKRKENNSHGNEVQQESKV